MLSVDHQVTVNLPSLQVGMVGFEDSDFLSSFQHVLTSQGSSIQITYLSAASAAANFPSLDAGVSFDCMVVDYRIKQGKKGMTKNLRPLAGDALILGLIDEKSIQMDGAHEADIDWLVEEDVIVIALSWAIKESRFRKMILAERNQLRRQLEKASYDQEMADIASTVLHNVGNVLNSVTVAVNVVHELVNQSSVTLVQRMGELLQGHNEEWGKFLTEDPKGKKIPPALIQVGSLLKEEQKILLKEFAGLNRNVDHVKQIILSHQALTKSPSAGEFLSVGELLDQAVDLSFQSGDAKWVSIKRDYHDVPRVAVDKHQLLQILVNLLRNAKQAMQAQATTDHFLTLQVKSTTKQSGSVAITIRDTGIGIAPQHLARIFTRGFTTKQDGNGIGLHSSMRSVQRMGGQLQVYSDGVGTGATLTVILPVQREVVR
jgi:signal transduction histidine kinase